MNQLIHLFTVGGFMMWPLLLASVIVIAIAVERVSFYRRSRTDMALIASHLPMLLSKSDFSEAQEVCNRAGGITGNLLGEATMHIGVVSNLNEYVSGEASHAASDLKAFLNYVSAIVTLSPLMGLLGTVIGMINSFDVLSISDGQPFAITGGVAEALVATGFGLLVAILAMVVHVWLSQWANKIISDIESGTSLFLASLPQKE